MTKKFSVLQRAAALLAALCLLAGLALPVCAEGADDALSAQNVETMQQGNAPTVETLPGEQTDEDKNAPDGAAAATPPPTPPAPPPPPPQDPAKGTKYHNTPTERVTASGAVLHFDSQKEARRFDALAARQEAGQIRDLRLQVDFTLQEAFTDTEGKRVRAIRYKADFTYYQPPNRQLYGSHAPYYAEQSGVPWEFVVEDVKSKATRTAKYAMKKKMLKDRFGYDITEV